MGAAVCPPRAAEAREFWGRCPAAAGAAAPPREPPRNWDQRLLMVGLDSLMSLGDLGTRNGKWGASPGAGAALPEQPALALALCCIRAGEMDTCSQKACRSEILPSLSDVTSKIPLVPLLCGLMVHPKCLWMGKLKPQTSSLIFMGY